MTDTRQQALPGGARIGIYEIKRVRGAGPFGITYRAWNQHLNTHMAIREYFPRDFAIRLEEDGRTIAPRSEGDQAIFRSGMSSFLEEAENLLRIDHPNLVCVHNTLEENGTAYVVMEYEDGISLADLCDRSKSRLGEEELKVIFLPILEALQQVHGKGLVHGGINPASILVRRNGEPVLLDFAASRLAFSARRDLPGTVLSEGYAPAEQYDPGNQPTPQTDLYALGATMYYCVTGLVPVAARRRISATQDEKPDSQRSAVEAAPPGYSETLLQTIDWMMSPRVTDRPQSAADVLAALGTNVDEDIHAGRKPEQKAESRWSSLPGPGGDRRFLQIAGAGLLLAVLAAAGGWYLWKPEEQPQYAGSTGKEPPKPATGHSDVTLTSIAQTEPLPPSPVEAAPEPLPEPEPSEAAMDDRPDVVAVIPPISTIEAQASAAPAQRNPDTSESSLQAGPAAREVPEHTPEPTRIAAQSDLDRAAEVSDYRAGEYASNPADSESARVAPDPLSQASPDAAPAPDPESRAETPGLPVAPRPDVMARTSAPEIKVQPLSGVPEPTSERAGPRQLEETRASGEIALVAPAVSEAVTEADTPAPPQFPELEPGTSPSPTAASQTPSAQAVQEDIERHMIAAEGDLAALRLTTPPGANAFEHYQAVLTLEPGHPGARKGLDLIVDRYAWLIENAINRGRYRFARIYLDRAQKIFPEAPDLRDMRAQLRATELARAQKEQPIQR